MPVEITGEITRQVTNRIRWKQHKAIGCPQANIGDENFHSHGATSRRRDGRVDSLAAATVAPDLIARVLPASRQTSGHQTVRYGILPQAVPLT
jgi:hypothetical protein